MHLLYVCYTEQRTFREPSANPHQNSSYSVVECFDSFGLARKQYSCSCCPYKTFKKYNIQTHFLIHTRQKPYQCNVCNKSFSQKGNLQRHFITHMAH
ncbi:hypothetical protein JTE90_012083 [Oedothorax gibbosus]|uniref:C2H2-type domain-containing protein n=1 Tax=Oedothorax gibbosus TaxID=931172 RepID=A0AAV6UKM3_9ARAC|nr:hypothetical protein JTE90_012083 [Oedothorax gibbosus]